MSKVLAVRRAPDGATTYTIEFVAPDRVRVTTYAEHVCVTTEEAQVYPKLSGDGYHFFIEEVTGRRVDDQPGITIRLCQEGTPPKVKTFFQAGGDLLRLVSHMNSLTDDLCSQWFNVREKKTKKEQ